jgi:hypothetical protein
MKKSNIKSIRFFICLFLIISNINKLNSQSLPISYYGVWDRGGGVQDYSDPKANFVKGIEIMAAWDEIQPINSENFDFSIFQKMLDTAAKYNKLIRFSINVGPDSPLWLYDNGVPRVSVNSKDKTDKYKDRYPYYLDVKYKNYFYKLIEKFSLFLRDQPIEKFKHVAFVQVKTGATGDEESYKGDPIDANYKISHDQWETFRLEAFSVFKKFFNEVSHRKIVISFNRYDPDKYPEAYNYIFNNMDPELGFGVKGGAYNRGHHLSDEQSYKIRWNPFLINPKKGPLNPKGIKLFSASEMDQSWEKGVFALNYEIGFYWSALGGINVGLSCTNISATAMKYAFANPGIIEIFKMYNRYAEQVYPESATTAFSVFHEGLNSADIVKFPEAVYGKALPNNPDRYTAICNDPKYYKRGARMEDLTAAVKGQVYQREDQEYYNDAGWDICEGNIERFITQLDPDNTSIGLFRVRGKLTATSSKYDRFARSFENSTGKNTMFFQIDKDFPANNKVLKFTIIWLDKISGSTWAFKYRNSAGIQAIKFKGVGTNEWKTENFTISDGIFNQAGQKSSDFMLVNTDETDDIFNSIEMNILNGSLSLNSTPLNTNVFPVSEITPISTSEKKPENQNGGKFITFSSHFILSLLALLLY